MVYVDSSVFLAALLAEQRRPLPEFWDQFLSSSRLSQFEVMIRPHARRAPRILLEDPEALFQRVGWLELVPGILGRALESFPVSLRTVDALHLARTEFLRGRGYAPRLATYDKRMSATAKTLGFELVTL